MPEFSVSNMPEIFVSDTSISKAVFDAVARGHLRKIGSRLYTRNLDEEPEKLVRRNWYFLITSYYPDALITDRTALENKPAADGSVCLISDKKRDTVLPGLAFRPRKGPGPLENDLPFIGGAKLVSSPRAYLENMRPSRARGTHLPRTLSRQEIETRLDTVIRLHGEDALNRLRDEACAIAMPLGLEQELTEFSDLVSTLLGTHNARIKSLVARARAAGRPFDPDRIRLFETLFGALRETVPAQRPVHRRSGEANTSLAFFEAYFSNFIEGTEFTVEEAEEIVFGGVIPPQRPDDARDILGTNRIVSDQAEMQVVASDIGEFLTLLQHRHATIMSARLDKNPGIFKTQSNRAGNTTFVVPDLVTGTLEQGFDFLSALNDPFQRAVFMMFLVSEVHPFTDGNGRIARIMMNAELVAGGQERIIVPTGYRIGYLTALKAVSQSNHTTPFIRMMNRAQQYTHTINWNNLVTARKMLEESGAFEEGQDAKLRMPEEPPT